MEEDYLKVKKVTDLNLKLLEEVAALDFSTLHEDAKDLLLSQLKITTGKLGNLIIKNGY